MNCIKHLYRLFWFAGLFISSSVFAFESDHTCKNSNLTIDKRVEDLVSRMTLKEKVNSITAEYSDFNKSNKKIHFPFGYGLSYTTVQYSKLHVSVQNEGLVVMDDIKNTGSVEGNETIQLYVHNSHASVKRPKKELKAFQRISLKSDEKRTIEFVPSNEAFAFWNHAEKQWKVESGKFEIQVGASSTDIRLTKKINI